jgi:hypothetical protein
MQFPAPTRSKARTEVRAFALKPVFVYAVASSTISRRERISSAAACLAVSPRMEFTTSTAL